MKCNSAHPVEPWSRQKTKSYIISFASQQDFAAPVGHWVANLFERCSALCFIVFRETISSAVAKRMVQIYWDTSGCTGAAMAAIDKTKCYLYLSRYPLVSKRQV